MSFRIRQGRTTDHEQWLALRLALWPGQVAAHEAEMRSWLERDDTTVFVAESESGRVIGFVEVALRDVAEGCDSTPVGYIEGWYVLPESRQKGIGRALIAAAATWASEKGCVELGSDTEIENVLSQNVHQRIGFELAGTLVHFRRRL